MNRVVVATCLAVMLGLAAHPAASCFKCHSEHAAVDNVFLQFYPVLRDAAPKK